VRRELTIRRCRDFEHRPFVKSPFDLVLARSLVVDWPPTRASKPLARMAPDPKMGGVMAPRPGRVTGERVGAGWGFGTHLNSRMCGSGSCTS